MPDSPGTAGTRARLAAPVAMLDALLHDLKQPLNLIRVVAQDVGLGAKKGRLEAESIPQSMDEIVAVEEPGGRLESESSPGQGATSRILIPAGRGFLDPHHQASCRLRPPCR